MRFHSRDDILVCVDASNRFRLLDVEKRRMAACHDDVEFPQVPSGKGVWGGAGDVHPVSGIAFNPEDPLHSMLLFNHRYCVLFVVVIVVVVAFTLNSTSKWPYRFNT